MSMNAAKVTVVGAGAIGGLFAGWLVSMPESAVKLSMVARGETLNVLRTKGLRLIHQETDRVFDLNATDDPKSLGEQDLVIVSVKAPALSQVAPVVSALLGKKTKVIVAMNGVPWWFFHGFGGECKGLTLRSVDPLGIIGKSIPADQVIGAVLHASAAIVEPGVIQHVAGKKLIIGVPHGNDKSDLDPLTQLLKASGWEVSV
jgi:2-dehydropantoate 2-reductase